MLGRQRSPDQEAGASVEQSWCSGSQAARRHRSCGCWASCSRLVSWCRPESAAHLISTLQSHNLVANDRLQATPPYLADNCISPRPYWKPLSSILWRDGLGLSQATPEETGAQHDRLRYHRMPRLSNAGSAREWKLILLQER